MLARRLDQERDIVEKTRQLANGVRLSLHAPEREQPLDLLLGHGQLPEHHAERLVSGLRRIAPRMELHAHPGTRQRVPQLVSQPGCKLRDDPGALPSA